jgi:type IV pilus assembly protein PilA
MKLQSKSGFSLVELMVVVAIIGILATIAVPNFQRFQARAKQASAKTELTGVYTAQKAFYVEYNSYHPDLQMTGFAPEGVSLVDGAVPVALDRNRIYSTTGGTIQTTASATGHMVYTELGLVASGSYGLSATSTIYPVSSVACNDSLFTLALVEVGTAFTRDTFTVNTSGCPRGKAGHTAATNTDRWSIDQLRALKNTQNGI